MYWAGDWSARPYCYSLCSLGLWQLHANLQGCSPEHKVTQTTGTWCYKQICLALPGNQTESNAWATAAISVVPLITQVGVVWGQQNKEKLNLFWSNYNTRQSQQNQITPSFKFWKGANNIIYKKDGWITGNLGSYIGEAEFNRRNDEEPLAILTRKWMWWGWSLRNKGLAMVLKYEFITLYF